MDSDQGKLFIGGVSWETTEEKLKEYFENYGEVVQTVVMKEKFTGRPRGFGFVVFADPSVLDRVLQDTHTIDGRTVEAKRALSREEQQTTGRTGIPNTSRNSGGGGGGGNVRTKKIFVGGLPSTLSEEGFREHFETYGQVTDVVVMYDQNTGRPRGFGFISFDTEDAVDRVLQKTFHDLNGKQVEVKRALPKDANPGGGGGSRPMGGGGSSGYGVSGGNQTAYDSRMDSSRFIQPQTVGGAFPQYGTPGYGYGPSNNGIGYGGYGSYPGANAGYSNPAGAAYPNPSAQNTGYPGGPGGSRSSWNAQPQAGYAAMGYGSAAPWGGAAAAASAGTGQSPSGGYGAQGYGYGGYGGAGADGAYGAAAGYGAVGGRPGNAPNSGGAAESGGGYLGAGGYGDVNGNGGGYGGGAWRSDQPQQGSGGYGVAQTNGGYGGVPYGSAPARQAQQQ